MRFVVDKLALGQIFPESFGFTLMMIKDNDDCHYRLSSCKGSK
jgi:hypothetical protein